MNGPTPYDNAAKYLLVKGKVDYVAAREGILATVTEPDLEVLEPIGGTGDTITGIAAALIEAGPSIPVGCGTGSQDQPAGRALRQPYPCHTGIRYY